MIDGTSKAHDGRALRFFAIDLVACGLAFFAASRIGGELRSPALWGAGAATVAALVAYPALALGMPKGTNGLLAGFSVGFLVRTVMVAVGLLASGARGDAALACAFSFFAVYAISQAIEVAFVWSASRSRAGVTS